MADPSAIFDRRLESASAAPLAVAVSGGADSLFALIETSAWARRRGRKVMALSVDHGLQEASAAWSRQAGDAAARLGCDFQLLRWTGPYPATGLQAAARAARHRLLADAARACGARVLILGHTGDDALENQVLGQGRLTEWGPSPVWPQGRGLGLLRPLLGLRRAFIRQDLLARDWTWVDDPANDNLASPRIRARRSIDGEGAPPSAEPVVVEGARKARLDDELIRLPVRDLDPRLLAAACLCLGGGETPPRRDAVRRLNGRLVQGGALAATLAGARVLSDGRTVSIARDVGETSRGGLQAIAAPGLWDGRYAIGGEGEVRALHGLTRRLPELQRRRLAALPAPARPGLPVVVNGETVTCPILAPDPALPIDRLWPARFLTACGVYAHETDLRSWLR